MKPVVGVTVCIDAGQRMKPGVDYLYLRRAYAEALAQAGATPILLSPEANAADCAGLCDALVISGGGDLPRRLGAASEQPLGEVEHPERVAWERELLDVFQSTKKPVLGVCYGMQLMNLHCGGTLYRSVAAEVASVLPHGGQGEYTLHDVTRVKESVLLASLPISFRSNSSHGQAVHEVAPSFAITARAADGVIEAIEDSTRRLFGVEWHPEADATASAVYGQFVGLIQDG